MVNRTVISSKANKINEHIKKIDKYMNLSKKEFFQDVDVQDIVEYNLFQIINHLISIMQHIVVDEQYALPETAYDSSYVLYDKGILSEKDLDLIKKMIGFRNIIGHDYINLNKDVVYFALREGIKDIKVILEKLISKFS